MKCIAAAAAITLAACSSQGPDAVAVEVPTTHPEPPPPEPTTTTTEISAPASAAPDADAAGATGGATCSPAATSEGSDRGASEGAPSEALLSHYQTAQASWYGQESGSATASGETFDETGLTFASRHLAMGTVVEFCHEGSCVRARRNDYGPATWTGRDFDLSMATFAAIAPLGAGEITVQWRVAA